MNSILRKSLGLVLVLFIMVLGLSNVVKVRATDFNFTDQFGYDVNGSTSILGDWEINSGSPTYAATASSNQTLNGSSYSSVKILNVKGCSFNYSILQKEVKSITITLYALRTQASASNISVTIFNNNTEIETKTSSLNQISASGAYANILNTLSTNDGAHHTLSFTSENDITRIRVSFGNSSNTYLSQISLSYSGEEASISISADKTTVYLDETLDFDYSTEIQNPSISWISSDTDIATIDSNGVLTPVSIGKTNIKAVLNETDSNQIEITVFPNPNNQISIAQANAIADAIGEERTNESFKIVGTFTYVDANNFSLTSGGTIAVYKYGHGYTADNNGMKVLVNGKITKYNGITPEFTNVSVARFFNVTIDKDNGDSPIIIEDVLENSTIDQPENPTKDGCTFNGWKKQGANSNWDFENDTINADTTIVAQWIDSVGTQFINLLNNYYAAMSLAYKYSKTSSPVIDTINYSFVGVSGTTYTDWNNKQSNSTAKYKGKTAGGNTSVQLRSSNSDSGIVTTVSGGYARTVTIAFNSHTADGRTLDVYGKNSAYSSATDLYNNSTKGTLLGSIVYGTSTSLTIEGDYEFIALRSHDGAIYIDSIDIEWAGIVFENCDFRLRCGIQNEDFAANLAAISGDATYGIEVKTTSVLEKTVNYASNNAAIKTDNENNMIYVLISLGDALSNPNRLGVEFTVRPYIEYESVKYYATDASCAKTYSVAQMVESYHNNPSTQDLVASLYALLQSMDIID